MRLLIPLLNIPEPYPVKDYSIRPSLRRDAVAKAISVFEENRDREKANVKDSQFAEHSDWNCEWLTETLIQSVYIREYHLWEKEAKSYLNGQRHLNGELEGFSWRIRKGEDLVSLVKNILDQFCATVAENTLASIDVMRRKVNEMKHTPSFEEKHLVSRGDYDIAAQAIGDFWGQLGRQQMYASMERGPHIDKYLDKNL